MDAGAVGDPLCLEDQRQRGRLHRPHRRLRPRRQRAACEKSQNVAAQGAVGFVLVNDEVHGDSLLGDEYALPGVFISSRRRSRAAGLAGHGHRPRRRDRRHDVRRRRRRSATSWPASRRAAPTGPSTSIVPAVTAPGVDILAAVGSDLVHRRRARLHLGHVDVQPARRRRRRPAQPGPPGLDAGAAAVGADDHGAHQRPQPRRHAGHPVPAGRRAHRRRRGGPRPACCSTRRSPTTSPPTRRRAATRRRSTCRRSPTASASPCARGSARPRCPSTPSAPVPPASRGRRRRRPTTGLALDVDLEHGHGVARRHDGHRRHRRRRRTRPVGETLFGRITLTPEQPGRAGGDDAGRRRPVVRRSCPRRGRGRPPAATPARRSMPGHPVDRGQRVHRLGRSAWCRATPTSGSLAQDPTSADPYDDLEPGRRPPRRGAGRAPPGWSPRSLAAEMPDLDLFVGTGLDTEPRDRGLRLGDRRASTSTATSPTRKPGTWWVLVQNWEGTAAQPDAYTLATGVVPGDRPRQRRRRRPRRRRSRPASPTTSASTGTSPRWRRATSGTAPPCSARRRRRPATSARSRSPSAVEADDVTKTASVAEAASGRHRRLRHHDPAERDAGGPRLHHRRHGSRRAHHRSGVGDRRRRRRRPDDHVGGRRARARSGTVGAATWRRRRPTSPQCAAWAGFVDLGRGRHPVRPARRRHGRPPTAFTNIGPFEHYGQEFPNLDRRRGRPGDGDRRLRRRAVGAAGASPTPTLPNGVIAPLDEVIRTDEFDNPDYLKNDGSRCYHCKSELYDQILARLPELGVGVDVQRGQPGRPGRLPPRPDRRRRAARPAPARRRPGSPRPTCGPWPAWGLPTWDKPASPCLSSRLAPGLAVTAERTARDRGGRGVPEAAGPARLPGATARRRAGPDRSTRRRGGPAGRRRTSASELARRFRELGFRFVTLDLEGFRSGSLNDLVGLEFKARYQDPAGRVPGGVP